MKKNIIYLAVVMFMLVSFSIELQAEKLHLKYVKASIITSPTEPRDSRILVYFRLPELLNQQNIRIDYAKLVFLAGIKKHPVGLVNISPVTSSWKDAGMITWKGLWEEDGGDYSSDLIQAASVTDSTATKEHRCDITNIVRSWLDGIINNEGLIIMPSESMLEDSPVEYNVNSRDIKLVINYTLDDDIERRIEKISKDKR